MAMDCAEEIEEIKRQKWRKERDLAISCMMNTEVGALLAVMRMNPIEQHPPQYIPGAEEAIDTSLLNSLKSLRTLIFNLQQDWHSMDPSIYLSPFLDVIQYDEISAPATGIALSAVLKILKLEIFDTGTLHAREAIHAIVEAITNCRLERTNLAEEDAILMRILQLLIACLKCKASVLLTDNAICTIVNTCYQVVQQSASRGHLLQRSARHTMHELVQVIYSHLPEVDPGGVEIMLDNDNITSLSYGAGCMADIFHFMCSLLNTSIEVSEFESTNSGPDEDVQLFALILINSAIELSGEAIAKHRKLLRMIQDELFYHLIHYGSHSGPLVLSMICSTVLNLYHNLRRFLRLQLEGFFWFVCLRIAGGKLHPVQQEEVAIEGLVSFCRQPKFGIEMYMNFDCDPMRRNIFEEIGKLFCKKAFPSNGPLTSIQAQSFEGMVVMIQNIADDMDDPRRSALNSSVSASSSGPFHTDPIQITEYTPFWNEKCCNYHDPDSIVEFMRTRKFLKKKLVVCANHFNRDEKKGLEFLKHAHLVPEPPDAHSIAYFLRFTPGLDKTLVGDYLGDPDEFNIKVLKEFSSTFDFSNMILDIALRNFLESFRLPGEAQKIQRILEAFAERFYEQSDEMFADKDAVFLLCYSLIMLNTDQHNVQVKKKMTEDEFIKNNRNINGGKDLPREYLSELFQSIATNEITLYDASGGFLEMNPTRWINVVNQANKAEPYIFQEVRPLLSREMFSTVAGPSIATLAAVFEHTDDDRVLHQCMEGFLAVARIARYKFEDVLDELLTMLCKFTTLLNPFSSLEETLYSFTEEVKPKIATLTVFTIANKFGDCIRTGWRNIVDCLLRLKKLKLLPPSLIGAESEAPAPRMDLDLPLHWRAESGVILPSNMNNESWFSSLMGKFTQFLSTEGNDDRLSIGGGSATDRNMQFIKQCCIEGIFSKSKSLHEDSLQYLGKALLLAAAGKAQKFTSPLDEEETAAFCWDLIVMITMPNIDRFMFFWPGFHEYLVMISQQPLFASCPFVEKSLFGVLTISKKILSKPDSVSQELIFKSLQIIWKLDNRVADSCCEAITQVAASILTEHPNNIQTQFGWKSILAILSISARHPEAFSDGVEALISLMTVDGENITKVNYSMWIESAFSFAASKLSSIDKSKQLLDLMAESVDMLVTWLSSGFSDPGSTNSNSSSSVSSDSSRSSISWITTMFVRLTEYLRKISLVRREEIRNHAVSTLKRCFVKADDLAFTPAVCMHCFNHVIFAMADDLLEKAVEYSRRENSLKEMLSMEGTLCLAMEFLTETYIQFLKPLSVASGFRSFWLGVLRRMDTCAKAELGNSDKLKDLIPELLKKMIVSMKISSILVEKEENDLWDITITQILWIAPAVKDELFPDN